MKTHLVIRLRRPAELRPPFWGDVVANKYGVPTILGAPVDRLLRSAGVPVWVTQEYPCAGGEWTTSEIERGLNCVYRLVLRRRGDLPAGLVEQVRLLPDVVEAHVADIATFELSRPAAAASGRRTDRASRRAVGLEQAHLVTQGHPEVKVAVLDTGMDEDHPELRSTLLRGRGRDFVNIVDGAEHFIGDHLGMDPEPVDRWVGHGTHVAGVIGGRGVAMPRGVAPRCRILNVRVLGAMRAGEEVVGAGLVDNINTAVKWTVDQGVDIINMSLGVRHSGGGVPYREVVDYAEGNGVSIVAASGNNGSHDYYYPGAHPFVITVGALDRRGAVADFSTYNRHVDLLAPGTDIYSSFLDGGYAFSSGTSHAAPFVTGAMALLHSRGRELGASVTDEGVKALLAHTSDRLDGRFKHPTAGYGRLNVPDALRLLSHRLN